ncbi:MAG: hypothetical protein IKT52_12620 [Oscillospiraceae bacterium]|nr:hypothetical protein [Oscillospiraceae bacterium]
MKKIVLYVLLLGATLLFPVQGEDVGKLLPVEVVQIYKEEDRVVIATDVGASGTGATVKEAIENLKATSAGIIFLDTADYLLFDESAKEEIGQLETYLKRSVRVSASDGEIDLHEAAAFLAVHQPAARLKSYKEHNKTEILTKEAGRMILKEK